MNTISNNIVIVSIIVLVLIVLLLLFQINAIYIYMAKFGLSKMKKGCLKFYSSDDGRLLFEINRSDEVIGKVYTSDFASVCKALVKNGDIGFGEEYMKGTWTSPDLIKLFMTFIINDKELQSKNRYNTIEYSDDSKNIKSHYDAGNDFYLEFLRDDLNAYSCGFYYCKSDDLNQSQYNKLNTVIKKLEIKPGMKILDIGCGWGKIMNYVSKQTNAVVEGITLSTEQVNYINNTYKHLKAYELHFRDLPTSLNGTYDRVYVIGMIEHVRCPNYKKFLQKIYDLLKPGGRLVLHTITFGVNSFSTCEGQTKTFISEYIFPGGQIPNREWLVKDAGEVGLKLVHMEVYGGQHYGKTLTDWRNHVLERKELLRTKGYGDEFIRKYDYYMAECAASFYCDRMNITHFVYDKIQFLTEANVNFQCEKH